MVKAGDYRNDPRNQRVLSAEYSRQRGQISAEGQVLASSTETDDRLRYLRTYPDGPEYAPITGYYSVIYGSSGMERASDAVLNGSDDRLFGRRLSDLITGRDPSGGNVVLTIDPAVQKVAYDQLTRKRYAGAVVALQPATGAVLAMASTPSFDCPLASHNTDEQKKPDRLHHGQAAGADNRAIRPPTRRAPRSLVDVAAALSGGRFTEDSRSRRHRASPYGPAPRWRTTTATRAAPAPRSACARRCSAPWRCVRRPRRAAGRSARSPTPSRSAW